MEADPDELLAWLKGDAGGERDLQISALEQLCKFKRTISTTREMIDPCLGMLVLMCDNIDRCFEQ
jgi:hypothetical protein